MTAFLELIQMSVISVLTVPISPLFWFVVYLVYIQYRRFQEMEIQALGESRKTIGKMVGNAIVVGIVGGLVGTIVVMILGITINIKDFVYILPLAILLMLINIRYLCFSYAGGILALSSLVLGFPKLNVSSILAVVGILHLVESILIWTDGHKDALPIFIKDKSGEVVGGFSFQRIWPIPFAILIFATGSLSGARDISLPDWWPLFSGNINIENISLQISAVVAALGYGDMAVTKTPKEKCHRASIKLFTYSIILLGLAILSTKFILFKYIAALFAPLGHEVLIIHSQKEEKNGTPMFSQPSKGVRILDVKINSVGWNMKLKSGDIILSINNREVNCIEDIKEILKDFPPYIWIKVKDITGTTRIQEYKDYPNGINNLGLILVSKDSDIIFEPKNSVSIIKNLAQKISKK